MQLTLEGLSPAILLVLGALAVFSITSWTILAWKAWVFVRVRRANRQFTDFVRENPGPAEADRLGPFTRSPLRTLFLEGWKEAAAGPDLDRISRTLRRASTLEIEALEQGVGFLATTASTTPFIGLFGTVWGIMNAFAQIGAAGTTSLAIVAPGISEALVTTAVGLAVAIPAAMGFNFLQSRLRRMTNEIDNFCFDFLNRVPGA